MKFNSDGTISAGFGLHSRKSQQAPAATSKKKEKSHFGSDIRYGKSISVNFFKKHAWLIIAFITVVVALTGLRYKTKTQLMEITSLKKELHLQESNKLREKAKYMSLIREAEMQRLVNQHQMNLHFQDEPPYELKVKK